MLALDALGARPANVKSCVEWLNTLQNADGGFGDRSGWKSRLYSTYYAVHALEILTGNVRQAINTKTVSVNSQIIPEGRYKIFQAQHKTPAGGTGMVDSLAVMKLNLVGVKTREMDTASETENHLTLKISRIVSLFIGLSLFF